MHGENLKLNFKALFISSFPVMYVGSLRVEALWFNSKFPNYGRIWKISTFWHKTHFVC